MTLAATALAVTASVAASAVDTRPATVRASSLFSSNPSAVPSTLEEFSRMPYEFRKEATRHLSPELKSELWRAQLRKFAAERDLTKPQQEFISSVIANLTPYKPGGRPAHNQAVLASLCAVAPTVFSKEDLQQFGMLGGPRSMEADSVFRKLTRTVKGAFGFIWTEVDASLTPCACTSSWCQDCRNDEQCLDETGCSHVPDNCGCWQAFNCDDQCVFIPAAEEPVR